MGLKVPKLDDVTFNKLVEEAIKKIPLYAPEWTDYNLHDPGITIIELLAWLVETHVFHLDQITETHYEKFLKLLEVEREPNETIDEAINGFRKDLRAPSRAVTLSDFEYLANKVVGVSRSKAVWLNDRVEIVILPVGVAQTEELQNRVCEDLDKCRLLTTRMEVVYPKYVPISVHATIKAKPLAAPEVVKKNIKDMLTDFLNPEHGYNGSGWPFGRNVYGSEVCARIEDVEGVDCVLDLGLSANNDAVNGNAMIGKTDLVQSGEHNIQIAGTLTCKGVL